MIRYYVFALLLFSLPLTQAARPLDSDADGYPDAVEIRSPAERAAFLDWFASVAEAQYAAPAADWEHQDCSGLLRYAFTEALSPKTAQWFERFSYFPQPQWQPVRSLSYPMPVISRSVFRIQGGAFKDGDVEAGRMVGMATAYELMTYASVLLGRDVSSARRGDLLFFAHPLAEGSAYHSMVYLGNTAQGKDMVVYHTGLSPDEGGEVRLLSLETLNRHPDASWHAEASNPHFLGFYRWKIVD